MRKFTRAAALLILIFSAGVARADNCATRLSTFTASQANQLCGMFVDPSTVGESLIPSATNSYDLGSLTKTFKDLYLGGNLKFTAASAKILPGATSLLVRNNADDNTNLGITDAGAATIRAGLVVTTGDITASAGDSLHTSTQKGLVYTPATSAAAGSTQGTATVIGDRVNFITGADGTTGVKFPFWCLEGANP